MDKNELKGYQARSYKSLSQKVGKHDLMNDLDFVSNPNRAVEKFEEKQKMKNIKDQMDYFGYELEPFNMKDERKIGNFDDGGFFVFDREKDK